MPLRSQDDWQTLIEPHLSSSLEAVSETITQSEPVQSWLREASTEAAEGLGQRRGMQAEMRGYVRMMEDLEDTLPELLAAVSTATAGCGTIDLKWRPLQPTQSRLYVDFDRDVDVDLFVRLDACTPEAARDALSMVAEALPDGKPYPNRPNTITGLVARDGQSVGVRLKEHLQENGGRRRSVTLLPAESAPIENLDAAKTPRRLVDLLCPNNRGG